jgi:hypothetical protein
MRRDDFNSYIQESNYTGLFVELGWNYVHSSDRINPIEIDETAYEIFPVADKQGFKALICHTAELPQHSVRRKIDFQLRKYFHYYVLIFIKDHSEHQMWMVPVKRVEKRDLVIVEYQSADRADFLFSKVADFRFGLEEDVTIVDVTRRVHGAFELNSERVTKDFYVGFRKQHTSFVKFIEGINVDGDRQWYASVMLNRLMFCYFIQKKGFLDFDVNYLRNKLEWTKEQQGENKFFGTFYKGFLLRLFHGGLNDPKHSQEFETKYGRIPYLNGGLFDLHQLEQDYSQIDIPDQAFEDLFDFFDNWRWHLDTRIEASGRDINPDVLGYIFEQYINDRAQMGAYYTKEDITEYISKNCILPFLMDEVSKSPSQKHFTPGGMVWETLRNSGDTYIYDAVKKGTEIKEIPEEIAVGLDTSKPDLLERRKEWNQPTPEAYALPTEIWRETIERRKRYYELLAKIRNGEITQINDFITYNLDIRQFVEDLLARADDHLFILHFYKALQNVTILDPTCGSGAFLFAALNILEPLYEICIIRMQEFNASNNLLFKEQLAEIEQKYRSNIQYFIYKSIILRNLYGVDIMHEATEIARLRLFLKMVAVVDVNPRADNLGLDPLPDIDFNIRCGNTLIGYATQAELEKDLVEGDMFANMEFRNKIEEEMQKVAMAYQTFKEIQLTQHDDMESFKHAKTELNNRLAKLNDTLNNKMCTSLQNQHNITYQDWILSHQPFHWLAEFYEIIQGKGGFDVIIGNPPYVVYTKKDKKTKKSVYDRYKLTAYKTLSCNNLYAFVIERSIKIAKCRENIGMIVPLTLASNNNMQILRNLITESGINYFSHYEIRPSKLFEGVDQRLTIFIMRKSDNKTIYTTSIKRWNSEYRCFLFNELYYTISFNDGSIWRFSNNLEISIYFKFKQNKTANYYLSNSVNQNKLHYRTAGVRYWIIFLLNGFNSESLSNKTAYFLKKEQAEYFMASFNSNLFWWYYAVNFDMFNLKDYMIFNFRLDYTENKDLIKLANNLEKDLDNNKLELTTNSSTRGIVKSFVYKKRLSKPIIDEIDKVLAKHYGFTEEELDFIINYDIKYRMGSELNAEE